MAYRAALDYLMKLLEKLHIRALQMPAETLAVQPPDLGLRRFLGLEADCRRLFRLPPQWTERNAIYTLTDTLSCSYFLLPLPGTPQTDALLIGPYLTFEKSREQLMEEAERFGVPARHFTHLVELYGEIPVLRDEAILFAAIHALGEILWGRGTAFTVIDAEPEATEHFSSHRLWEEEPSSEEVLQHMRSMEERYAYENRLMAAVSQGLTHRAELMVRGFSELTLEQRSSDPLRNMKNYAIICNTLMRKAAENGGVHPVYLHSASAELARKIETVTDYSDASALMRSMVRTYCRLVRRHAARHYSPLVQRAVACMEADLSADLSLHTLAAMENVSAGYLSTLFHKETGKTVTEFATSLRMEAAGNLLRTTHLQVQTVAQHCGISDVNYFSKLFKRHFGLTPRQFRSQHFVPSAEPH